MLGRVAGCRSWFVAGLAAAFHTFACGRVESEGANPTGGSIGALRGGASGTGGFEATSGAPSSGGVIATGGASTGGESSVAASGGQAGVGGSSCQDALLEPSFECSLEAESVPYRMTLLSLERQSGLAEPRALSINDGGVILGEADSCSGKRSFIYGEDGVTELTPGFRGEDINDVGVIVGRDSDGFGAFWRDGVVSRFSQRLVRAYTPMRLNNRNQVVVQDSVLPWLWDNGVEIEFGPDMIVDELNDAGQVIGASQGPPGIGWLWERGVMTPLPPLAGGIASRPTAINNHGEIVGSSFGPGVRIVKWVEGTAIDITPETGAEVRYGYAADINDSGAIVGYLQDAGSHLEGAGFVLANGNLTWLSEPNRGSGPSRINAQGDVLGEGAWGPLLGSRIQVWSPRWFDVCCFGALRDR